MCSAATDKEIIDYAIALGASGYITKPFLPEAIIASLGMI
jgi:AmiR/NasT family two-component response regulator